MANDCSYDAWIVPAWPLCASVPTGSSWVASSAKHAVQAALSPALKRSM